MLQHINGLYGLRSEKMIKYLSKLFRGILKTPEQIEFEILCIELKKLLDDVRQGGVYNKIYYEHKIFKLIKRGGELLDNINEYDKEYVASQSLKCF